MSHVVLIARKEGLRTAADKLKRQYAFSGWKQRYRRRSKFKLCNITQQLISNPRRHPAYLTLLPRYMCCNLACIQAHAYQDSKTPLTIYPKLGSHCTDVAETKPPLSVCTCMHPFPPDSGGTQKHYTMLRKRVSCFFGYMVIYYLLRARVWLELFFR